MSQLLPEHYIMLLDYPNYEVSTWGNVRNRTTGKILKQCIGNHGYKIVGINGYGMKTVHRLVACAFLNNIENKKNVDHIDRKKTNNNILNLRFATDSENQHNKSIQKSNTSGVSGVHWHNGVNKWCVEIRVNTKYLYLGLFVNFDEAVKVRKEAEIIYFKEFRPK